MSGKSKSKRKVSPKKDPKLISSDENLKIEKEKRYQDQLRKNRKPQVEKLTQLKETKKKPALKPSRKAR